MMSQLDILEETCNQNLSHHNGYYLVKKPDALLLSLNISLQLNNNKTLTNKFN